MTLMAADPRRRSTVATEAILEQLNAEIAARGQSIKSVSAALGYDYNTFRRWMNGEREIKIGTVIEVVDLLHVDRAVFFARATAREHGR